MLVLSRGRNESIVIGDDVTITILDVDTRRSLVRLGIEAPIEVVVHRSEVAERIERERRERDGEVI